MRQVGSKLIDNLVMETVPKQIKALVQAFAKKVQQRDTVFQTYGLKSDKERRALSQDRR